jgi:hypothetical protein
VLIGPQSRLPLSRLGRNHDGLRRDEADFVGQSIRGAGLIE